MILRLISTAAVACLCLSGCKQETTNSGATTNTSSGNPLTAPADYVGALGQAQKSAQKTLSSAGLTQAINAFVAEQGRLPKSLDELKSSGVQIPAAPTGMKWDYDPRTGAVKAIPQ